jgi:hypothetical protein
MKAYNSLSWLDSFPIFIPFFFTSLSLHAGILHRTRPFLVLFIFDEYSKRVISVCKYLVNAGQGSDPAVLGR